MYAEALKVLERDKKSHKKDDTSDNDKDLFAFSSKGDNNSTSIEKKKDFNAKL